MTILKNKLVKKFASIPNSIVVDMSISAGALRVYLYLASKPEEWEVINSDIQNKLDIKQAQTIANYWKELIASGWITRRRILNDKNQYSGGFNYELNDAPDTNLNNEEPYYGKSLDRENPEYIINTDIESKTNSRTLKDEDIKNIAKTKFVLSDNLSNSIVKWMKWRKQNQYEKTDNAVNEQIKQILDVKNTYNYADDVVIRMIDHFINIKWKNINVVKVADALALKKKEAKIRGELNNGN